MNNTFLKVLGVVAIIVLGAVLVGAITGGTLLFTSLLASDDALQGQEVEEELEGLIVTLADADGPAAEAGVMRGDILLRVDGEEVNSAEEILYILRGMKPGEEVALVIRRGEKEREIEVELGDKDERAYLGISVCCGERSALPHLDTGPAESKEGRQPLPRRFLNEFSGVLIMQVVEGSPAEEAGLQPGDVIFSLDGNRLGEDFNFAEAIAVHEPGEVVELGVRRPGQEESVVISVRLGESPDEPEVAYLGVFYRQIPEMGSLVPFAQGSHRKPGQRGERFFFHEDPHHDPGEGGEPFFFQMPKGIPYQRFLGPDRDLGPFQRFMHFQERPGALISEVFEDTPAEAAGLQPGDLIVEVEGDEISGFEGLVEALADYQPGDEVELTVYQHEGGGEKVTVILSKHPDDPDRAYLGVSIAQITIPEHMDEAGGFHFGPFHFDFDFEDFDFKKLLPDPEDA